MTRGASLFLGGSAAATAAAVTLFVTFLVPRPVLIPFTPWSG
jgi:hypothetical protein